MTERAKIVDKAFWMAQTNAPDIYTKGRVRLAAALRAVVQNCSGVDYDGGKRIATVSCVDILTIADEVEAL